MKKVRKIDHGITKAKKLQMPVVLDLAFYTHHTNANAGRLEDDRTTGEDELLALIAIGLDHVEETGLKLKGKSWIQEKMKKY